MKNPGIRPDKQGLSRFFRLRPTWAFLIFVLLDTICVGMGMGVPIVNILFGFVVGWYIVGLVTATTQAVDAVLARSLLYAVATAAVTFLGMALIWGRMVVMLFDPSVDLANTGIPLILYEPKASFIGWLVLMIFISPFLQLLTTMFASYLSLLYWLRKDRAASAPLEKDTAA